MYCLQIKPAADQVAQNAEPLADRAVKEGIRPAAEAVSENAEPMAQKFTEGQLKPAAAQVPPQSLYTTPLLSCQQQVPDMCCGCVLR